MNQLLHFFIGISLFLFVIFLYLGLRPIFLLASFTLAIFILDYSVFPFIYVYQAFQHWLPILFEFNVFNTILIFTRLLRLSTFWVILFLTISFIRSTTLIYCRYLPIDDKRRLFIENQIFIYTNLFAQQFQKVFNRFIQLFSQTDEKDLDKFQLQQIHSTENLHDETIHRFQQLAHDLNSPTLDCSNISTPPVRRHHQRLLQQSDLDPLSRTPITPAHTNFSKGNPLHSTINGSYTGPMTRNRTKTGGSSSSTIPISPLKTKTDNEMNSFIGKRDLSHLTSKDK